MKKIFSVSLLLAVFFCGVAFAQQGQGYRTGQNISEEDLKKIYVSFMLGGNLSQDQDISWKLVQSDFISLTQTMVRNFVFLENATLEQNQGQIASLWKNSNFWLTKDAFDVHPFYRALYCTFLMEPVLKKYAGFQEGSSNYAFAVSTYYFVGCPDLRNQLKDQLPELEEVTKKNREMLSQPADSLKKN